MGIVLCHPDDLLYSPISSGWHNVIWTLSHPDELAPGRISSGWLLDTTVCHPDDISYRHMSSGWLSRNWCLIRMSFDNVIMSCASILKSAGRDSKFRFSTPRDGPSALPYICVNLRDSNLNKIVHQVVVPIDIGNPYRLSEVACLYISIYFDCFTAYF